MSQYTYYLGDNGVGVPHEIYRGAPTYKMFSGSGLERAKKKMARGLAKTRKLDGLSIYGSKATSAPKTTRSPKSRRWLTWTGGAKMGLGQAGSSALCSPTAQGSVNWSYVNHYLNSSYLCIFHEGYSRI